MGRSDSFDAAVKSFTGYLEGTKKSHHTIKNYRIDLQSFQKYLSSTSRIQPLLLGGIRHTHVDNYHSFLKECGLKNNTCRRRLMTIRKFLTFLVKRKKLPNNFKTKILAPHKIERIPFTAPYAELIKSITELPVNSELTARNRVLLWMLAETGCLVSEVTRLKFNQLHGQLHTAQPYVEFHGKSARNVPISTELHAAATDLQKYAKNNNQWLFLGYNRFGPLGGPISPRGVELLVRSCSDQLPSGKKITPRTFRHSVVLKWFMDGHDKDKIQKLLGLKTNYAFRSYEPLIKSQTKSNQKATSIS